MIVIADAGPILHLFWVDALLWALPPQEIIVVDAVRQEVAAYAPDALSDDRLSHAVIGVPISPLLEGKRLHTGEIAALSYALTKTEEDQVLILSDDHRARQVCRSLVLPFIGSIGLIVEALHAGLVSQETAQTALHDLPTRGRLYVKPTVIAQALAVLESETGGIA